MNDVYAICDQIHSRAVDRHRFTYFCARPFSRRSKSSFEGTDEECQKALQQHRRRLETSFGIDQIWFTSIVQATKYSDARYVMCVQRDLQTAVVVEELHIRIGESSSDYSTDSPSHSWDSTQTD